MRMLLPPGWSRPKGFANGIAVRGEIVFVAGQVGWDETESFVSDNFAEQFGQALKNVRAVLAEAGAEPHHIARMTWYITTKAEYLAEIKEIGRHYRAIMGKHFPVMSVVEVSALIEDRAKVEIEVTAVIPD